MPTVGSTTTPANVQTVHIRLKRLQSALPRRRPGLPTRRLASSRLTTIVKRTRWLSFNLSNHNRDRFRAHQLLGLCVPVNPPYVQVTIHVLLILSSSHLTHALFTSLFSALAPPLGIATLPVSTLIDVQTIHVYNRVLW